MASTNQFSIGNPELSWDERGNPYSKRNNDIYFLRDKGPAESDYVFLGGIDAPEVWRGKQRFVIGELGFGTGLNFFTTWLRWRSVAQPNDLLYYVGIEGYPLNSLEILRAIGSYSNLLPLAKELVGRMPPIHQGYQLIQLDDNKVFLSLLLGPVEHMLSSLVGDFDAWYLDGFTPGRNPQMWTLGVFDEISRLSHRGTRLATFSASSYVRRGLEKSGFKMAKRPGFESKRECLYGKYYGGNSQSNLPTYFSLGEPIPYRSRIAVIGGGIGGSAIANFLQSNGVNVTLYEQNAKLAAEASGNPAAVIQPRIADPNSYIARFQTDAYLGAIKKIESLDSGFKKNRGVISIGRNEEFLSRHIKYVENGTLPEGFADVLNKSDLSDLAGIDMPSMGVFHPQAGVIDPTAVCQELLSGINVRLNANVGKLCRTPKEWIIYGGSEVELGRADVVVLANSIGSLGLSEWCDLRLTAKRGEISYLSPTPKSLALRCSISYGGYVTPVLGKKTENFHMLGATFDRTTNQDYKEGINKKARKSSENLATIFKRSEELSRVFGKTVVGGRSAVRATTNDHMPVLGPLFLELEYRKVFSDICHGKPFGQTPIDSPMSIYVFNGFGSHGFSLAPHAASLLGTQMLGLPIPADRRIIEAVHPARFLMRELKKCRVPRHN